MWSPFRATMVYIMKKNTTNLILCIERIPPRSLGRRRKHVRLQVKQKLFSVMAIAYLILFGNFLSQASLLKFIFRL